MKKHSISDVNRSISALFTPPTFKDIFKVGKSEHFLDKISVYKKYIGIKRSTTIGKVINKAYKYLTLNYRNEYVYKNIIANKLLLQRHNLSL